MPFRCSRYQELERFKINGTQVVIYRWRLSSGYHCKVAGRRLEFKYLTYEEASRAGVAEVLSRKALHNIWNVLHRNGIPTETIAILMNAN